MTAEPNTSGLDVVIVLVEPARGGNVGAAARAMKTMGFDSLRIVSGETPLDDPPWERAEARAFAHGSTEILDALSVHETLHQAVHDRDVVVGSTARRRGSRAEYATPTELREMLAGGVRGRRIALVFGREESGLSNAELDLCHITTSIPMRRSYPSLNLSQAVMVYCYELAPLRFEILSADDGEADPGAMKTLHSKARAILPALGFDPGRALYGRMIERIGMVRRTDAHLLLSLLNALEKRLPPE